MTRFTHRSRDYSLPSTSWSRDRSDRNAVWAEPSYAEMHQLAYDDTTEGVQAPSWARIVLTMSVFASVAGLAWMVVRGWF